MNANYIYDIFTTCEENDLPDLTIALAHLQTEQPIPEGMTDQDTREFIGRHYNALVEGYKAHDRVAFATVVAECVALDEQEAGAQA